MREWVMVEQSGHWKSTPESCSGKSKGWGGVEVPKKKADFSGSVLGAGETGRWPGNNERTKQCGHRQDTQVDQASRSGVQGNKRMSSLVPLLHSTQEKGSCPLRGRMRGIWRARACVCVCMCERERLRLHVWLSSICTYHKGGQPPGPFWFSGFSFSCFHQLHILPSPCPSRPSGNSPGAGLRPVSGWSLWDRTDISLVWD